LKDYHTAEKLSNIQKDSQESGSRFAARTAFNLCDARIARDLLFFVCPVCRTGIPAIRQTDSRDIAKIQFPFRFPFYMGFIPPRNLMSQV
jgi:hypothetical protein